MATVYTGSASIDERGKTTGGAAGDQNGRELRIQPWYRHSLGWVVIRAKSAIHRAGLAAAMRAACDNPLIGYDQYQRDTLYHAAKPLGFDPGRVAVACETDCSALVRVCCAYVGIDVPNFRTYNQPSVLKATGLFDVLTTAAYTNSPDRLLAGDILCTKTSGHTIIVLNDGDLARGPIPVPPTNDLVLFSQGAQGLKVKAVQIALNAVLNGEDLDVDGDYGPLTAAAMKRFQVAYDIAVTGQFTRATLAALMPEVNKGDFGALVKIIQALVKADVDGDFGPQTEGCVRAFQKAHGLGVDGVVGPKTWTALLA